MIYPVLRFVLFLRRITEERSRFGVVTAAIDPAAVAPPEATSAKQSCKDRIFIVLFIFIVQFSANYRKNLNIFTKCLRVLQQH